MDDRPFIGLMSGTSADGVDAVVAHFTTPPRVQLLAHHHAPYPATLRARILALMIPGADEIDRMGALEVELAERFAQAALAACDQAGLRRSAVVAIGSHGQTVRHRPDTPTPFTLQIGDPSRIAERTGITTVADFRRRDIAAGGQGAPLVPAFHRWLFAHPSKTRAIINIGGIANVTVLPADPRAPVLGFDTGPGNALLDTWIHQERGLSYDAHGAWAASGTLNERLLQILRDDAYFRAPPPKSTGREYFSGAWLHERLTRYGETLAAADVQATLTRLTAVTILEALEPARPDELFVCGGGSDNRTLIGEIARAFTGPVMTTEGLGLAPPLVEPTAFAWLAAATLARRPGNLPSATGARHAVILGGVYGA
ncbi:MAG: anhydro-N-acetylmuramic acid kinase [Acidiferrobacter sp.]